MPESESLPDFEALAAQLWKHSRTLLRQQREFLPHAAVMSDTGDVSHVGAGPSRIQAAGRDAQVLRLLHEGLQLMAEELPLRAIGVAQLVTVTPDGQGLGSAIRVHLEHRLGLTVAWYLPLKKDLLRRYSAGQRFTRASLPVLSRWRDSTG